MSLLKENNTVQLALRLDDKEFWRLIFDKRFSYKELTNMYYKAYDCDCGHYHWELSKLLRGAA